MYINFQSVKLQIKVKETPNQNEEKSQAVVVQSRQWNNDNNRNIRAQILHLWNLKLSHLHNHQN